MDTLRHVFSISLLSLVVCEASIVMAQTETMPPRGPVPLTVYDRDGDGAVSEAEFNAVRAAREKENASQGRAARGAADAPTFEELDSDGDGYLTAEELSTGQAAQRDTRGMGQGPGMGMGQGPGKGQGPGMGPGKGRGPGMNRPDFADFDLDGNGVISEEEFKQAHADRISERAEEGRVLRNQDKAPAFEDIDENGDGEISAEEFAEHQQRFR